MNILFDKKISNNQLLYFTFNFYVNYLLPFFVLLGTKSIRAVFLVVEVPSH